MAVMIGIYIFILHVHYVYVNLYLHIFSFTNAVQMFYCVNVLTSVLHGSSGVTSTGSSFK